MPSTKINDKLYSWASDIDPGAILQAEKTSRLPIVEGHVSLMPDAHVGIGATVGSVIPTKGAIIPAAVGVDIGCGMIAAETSLSAEDLPDDLGRVMRDVEQAVPAGLGKWHSSIGIEAAAWLHRHAPVTELDAKLTKKTLEQFGTLGSGNHFFEVCLDERDVVWLVLHSGSRGIGNQLAQRHISTARTLAKDLELRLEDPDLAYFMEGTAEFKHYIGDMLWAQDYAKANRQQMMSSVQHAFFKFIGRGQVTETTNCHHNFTERETHGGQEVWITRKGAIKADVGDTGVIPGSMGTRSYIVKGKGNPLSYNSCSHGAGRRMSRGAAKKQFTADDLRAAMQGKVWLESRADSLIDEIPSSYKDIDVVMADQEDLVQVVRVLHQILNYKGC